MKMVGSGSVISVDGSADRDLNPHQNVKDPQHGFYLVRTVCTVQIVHRLGMIRMNCETPRSEE
ncbi:MAG: hypothetical protein AN484_28725, partial [Aphanizomenon flos-aquae WA102]